MNDYICRFSIKTINGWVYFYRFYFDTFDVVKQKCIESLSLYPYGSSYCIYELFYCDGNS